MYSISASDFSKMFEIDPKTAYRELQSAALTLKRREVRITQEPNGIRKRKSTLIAGWVQSIKYTEGEGTLGLRFNHDILPYLTELSKCFTSYKLKNVVSMSSSYGVRFYELLVQWKDLNEREVSLEWLRHALALENKYNAMKDFKKYVLEPAVNDKNKNSNLWVKWIQKKTGRKITHLVFRFGLKKEKEGVLKKHDVKIQGIPKTIIEKNAKPGETYEQAAMRIKNKSFAEVS
jgi:plasmid replication initiation protein